MKKIARSYQQAILLLWKLYGGLLSLIVSLSFSLEGSLHAQQVDYAIPKTNFTQTSATKDPTLPPVTAAATNDAIFLPEFAGKTLTRAELERLHAGMRKNLEKTELTDWEQKAKDGSLPAQRYLCQVYYTTQRYITAYPWCRLAAAQRDSTGQFFLGILHYHGRGIAKNVPAALELWEAAARNDFLWAQYYLGFIYRTGAEVEKNDERAFLYYLQAAQGGIDAAKRYVAWMYVSGTGAAPDLEQALRWYEDAANHGNAGAQYDLGWLYFNGVGVAQDYKQAAQWFLAAAEQDYPPAQLYLGVMYGDGKGVQQNNIAGYKWLYLGRSRKYNFPLQPFERTLTEAEIAAAKEQAGIFQQALTPP